MNEERNYRIVDLWNKGYCTSEVARDVGCTKNVVLSAIVKHRKLGDIMRPTVESYSDRGRLGNVIKYGLGRKKRATQRTGMDSGTNYKNKKDLPQRRDTI
jgi:hypothetical protein